MLHVALGEALEELLVLLQVGIGEVLPPLPRLQVDSVDVVERRPVVAHHLLPVLPKDPAGLGLVEADGLRRHLRRDDVPGHEEVHLVLELHLRLLRADPLIHLI